MHKLHRAFGIYGIFLNDKHELLVIRKSNGPYIDLFDLPGGGLEDFEGLEETLTREIKEETGLTLKKSTQLGIKSYI